MAKKGISLLKYLSKYVDRNVLNLYKLYVHPQLDYGGVIYHNQRDDLMYNTRLPSLYWVAGNELVVWLEVPE